jgi:hypothetical protein
MNKRSEGIGRQRFFMQSPYQILHQVILHDLWFKRSSIQCKMILDRSTSIGEVDGLILVIDIYVSATPLRWDSVAAYCEHELLCGLLHIYMCHWKRGLSGPLGFEEYHLYENCTGLGSGQNPVALFTCTSWGVDNSPSTVALNFLLESNKLTSLINLPKRAIG